jgi:hypothetical protein
MIEKYKLCEFKDALSETLSLLDAPKNLPKLGIMINRLCDIIRIIQRYSNENINNDYLEELLSNISEINLERLSRHDIYPITGVYELSPFYYFLVSVEDNLWSPSLQLCSAIFFSQLINDSHEKGEVTNLSLSNQNLLRQLLTSSKNISGYSFNIFSVYSVLNDIDSFELFTNNHLAELNKIFEKIFKNNPTGLLFISSIKAFELGTLRQKPPRIRKNNTNFPQQIEHNRNVKRIKLDASKEADGEFLNHELLEVETGSQSNINTVWTSQTLLDTK